MWRKIQKVGADRHEAEVNYYFRKFMKISPHEIKKRKCREGKAK